MGPDARLEDGLLKRKRRSPFVATRFHSTERYPIFPYDASAMFQHFNIQACGLPKRRLCSTCRLSIIKGVRPLYFRQFVVTFPALYLIEKCSSTTTFLPVGQ